MATGGAGTGLLNVPCGAELSAPLAAPLVAPSTTDGSTVQAGGPLHAPEAADRAGTASEEPPIVPAAVAAIGDAGTGAGAPAATALSGHSAAPMGHPSVAALPAGGLNVPSAAGAAGAAASTSAAAAAAAWNVPCDATDASSTASIALNLPVPVAAVTAAAPSSESMFDAPASDANSMPVVRGWPGEMKASAVTRNPDAVINVFLVGDEFVGKTTLWERMAIGRFSGSPPRVNGSAGVDRKTVLLQLAGKRVRCQLFDASGMVIVRRHAQSYWPMMHGFIFVFKATEPTTLRRVREDVVRLGERVRPRPPCILVANFCDCAGTTVGVTAGRAVAEELGMPFFEASSKTGDGVEAAFCAIVRAATAWRLLRTDPPTSVGRAGSSPADAAAASSSAGRVAAGRLSEPQAANSTADNEPELACIVA